MTFTHCHSPPYYDATELMLLRYITLPLIMLYYYAYMRAGYAITLLTAIIQLR